MFRGVDVDFGSGPREYAPHMESMEQCDDAFGAELCREGGPLLLLCLFLEGGELLGNGPCKGRITLEHAFDPKHSVLCSWLSEADLEGHCVGCTGWGTLD